LFLIRRLADWSKIIDKIEKGEKKIHRLSDIRRMIQEKVELHLENIYGLMYPGVEDGKVAKEILEQHSPMDLLMYSWPKMQFKYGQGQKGFSYQQEEDAFLLVMMHRHGYGAARRIQLEIRRAWQFRFNWFFKSRSPQEIQQRCDVLVSYYIPAKASCYTFNVCFPQLIFVFCFGFTQIRVVEREIQQYHENEASKGESGDVIGSIAVGGESALDYINTDNWTCACGHLISYKSRRCGKCRRVSLRCFCVGSIVNICEMTSLF